jgi:PIN domain nuclease of toxin-antitoxin system
MLIWWLDGSDELPKAAREAIADPAAEVAVSSISLAEISIKRAIGKLRAPWIPDALLAENGISVLSFTSDHARRLLELPLHHRDPFDRMLIAQAIDEDMAFATADTRAAAYGVRTL